MRIILGAIILAAGVYSLPVTQSVAGHKYLVTPYYHEIMPSRERRSTDQNDQRFPDHLQFAFNIEGKQVTLNLQKNTRISANPPVYVTVHETITKKDMQNNNYALYQDVNTGSAMLVTCTDDPESCKLHGSFHHQKQAFHMTPSTGSLVNEHIVQALETKNIEYDGDALVPPPSSQQKGNDKQDHTSTGSRAKRDLSGVNIVEILACPDESVYEHFLGVEGSEAAAEVAMQLHYALLMNEIDLHYISVGMVDKSNSLDIRIYLAGVVIAKQNSDAQWSTDHESVIDDVTYLNANTALSAFSEWVDSKSDLPVNDHEMAFTRKDFAYISNDVVTSKGIAGQAYLSQICKFRSKSIVEDDGDRRSTIAAHELGHSLSANHDVNTTGTVLSCPPEASNIMTSVIRSTVNSTYAAAQWTFSLCSVEAFRTYIDGLGTGHCMTVNNFDESEYNSRDLRLPGEIYSIDQQCQFNDYASSCDRAVSEDDCHSGIHCNNGTGCFGIYFPLYVMSGTPCGNPQDNKWCYRGLCVEKSTETSTASTSSITLSTTPPTTSSSTSSTTSTSPSTTSTTSPTTSTTSSTTSTTSPRTSSTTTTVTPTTSTTSSTTSTTSTSTSSTTTTVSPSTSTTSSTTSTTSPITSSTTTTVTPTTSTTSSTTSTTSPSTSSTTTTVTPTTSTTSSTTSTTSPSKSSTTTIVTPTTSITSSTTSTTSPSTSSTTTTSLPTTLTTSSTTSTTSPNTSSTTTTVTPTTSTTSSTTSTTSPSTSSTTTIVTPTTSITSSTTSTTSPSTSSTTTTSLPTTSTTASTTSTTSPSTSSTTTTVTPTISITSSATSSTSPSTSSTTTTVTPTTSTTLSTTSTTSPSISSTTTTSLPTTSTTSSATSTTSTSTSSSPNKCDTLRCCKNKKKCCYGNACCQVGWGKKTDCCKLCPSTTSTTTTTAPTTTISPTTASSITSSTSVPTTPNTCDTLQCCKNKKTCCYGNACCQVRWGKKTDCCTLCPSTPSTTTTTAPTTTISPTTASSITSSTSVPTTPNTCDTLQCCKNKKTCCYGNACCQVRWGKKTDCCTLCPSTPSTTTTTAPTTTVSPTTASSITSRTPVPTTPNICDTLRCCKKKNKCCYGNACCQVRWGKKTTCCSLCRSTN